MIEKRAIRLENKIERKIKGNGSMSIELIFEFDDFLYHLIRF